jgi:hypothetical protein
VATHALAEVVNSAREVRNDAFALTVRSTTTNGEAWLAQRRWLLAYPPASRGRI